jgi:hypothetical protein
MYALSWRLSGGTAGAPRREEAVAKLATVPVMVKRAKTGDVLALRAPDGEVYVHYLGKHVEYGDGIAVCPAVQRRGVAVTPDLFQNAYVTFYPATAAVARGMAEVVGSLPSPGLPRRFRRPGARSGRLVKTWILEDAAGAILVKELLSEEDLHLPIAVIWNHEFLLQRVAEGWRPEMEGNHE